MGQIPGWHRDKSGARRRLLAQLAEFARITRARVLVVFDGAPDREIPAGSAFRGVKVEYADRGSDADAKIVRLLESSRDPRGLTVVTSDRRLATLVHARGATVIRSGEFRKRLEDALSSHPITNNGEQTEVGSLEEWFKYFGSSPEDDES
jgi:predicted RNA-binding protein with PIN domain